MLNSNKRKISPHETVSPRGEKSKISKKPATPKILSPFPERNHANDLRRLQSNSAITIEKDYFTALPDEIILMIFRNCSKPTLVNCARVCRRWKDIAFDSDLWIRIDLSQRKLLSGVMTLVLSRKPIVLQMLQTEVDSPIFMNTVMNNSMTEFSNKIEYLNLSMATIFPQDLFLLLKTCHSLVNLNLENCEVNENVCEEIGKNVKLKTLNLSQCSGINDIGLKSFLKNCRNLVELNIAWTSLNACAIKSVCQFLPNDISRLNFSGCVKEMTDAHVNMLVFRCNKLKELDLSDATGITGLSVKAICENLTRLEIVSLSRCYNIHPSNYTKLLTMPFLTHLNIFGLFSESQIEQLRKSYRIVINQMKFSYIARCTHRDR